jgi:NitT/TauT family transport system substrate-binding protein
MTQPVSRRALLAAGAASLAAGSIFRWSPAIAAPAPVTIRQGLFTSVGLPGIFAAIQQGYFRQQGIQIDLQFFGNGPAMISAMLGGSLDITHADTLSWATAVLGGRDIVLVTPANAGEPRADAGWRREIDLAHRCEQGERYYHATRLGRA